MDVATEEDDVDVASVEGEDVDEREEFGVDECEAEVVGKAPSIYI